MRKFKLVGLTGRTGSGKGIAREVFEEFGYKVIDADLLAREALENKIVMINILSAFGADLLENDSINRKELAKRAFKDDKSTKTLNSITHPCITALFVENLRELSENGADKILFDAPQLFEARLDVFCDSTVALVCDDKFRIERIIKRDNISEEMAKSRLKIQLSDKFFTENCDYCIENNSSLKELRDELRGIIPRI